MSRETELINEILAIELDWFLAVNADLSAESQQNPETFKVIRGSSFETWSEQTLNMYLEHLLNVQQKGRNLVKEKYARMTNLGPPLNDDPTIDDIIMIEEDWQREAANKYPHLFGQEGGTEMYLRCELETYSNATLDSYFKDLSKAWAEGRNAITERYDRLAQTLGYSSLEEWDQEIAKQPSE